MSGRKEKPISEELLSGLCSVDTNVKQVDSIRDIRILKRDIRRENDVQNLEGLVIRFLPKLKNLEAVHWLSFEYLNCNLLTPVFGKRPKPFSLFCS